MIPFTAIELRVVTDKKNVTLVFRIIQMFKIQLMVSTNEESNEQMYEKRNHSMGCHLRIESLVY